MSRAHGRRAILLGALGAAVARGARPAPAGAQATAKPARVGFLTSGARTGRPVEAFRQGFRELGWEEGRTVVIEYGAAEGRPDRLPELAADLVRRGVDVIVAGGSVASVAASRAAPAVPVVMVGVPDAVALGLIQSVARPGGHVTGLSISAGMETYGKALELLAETLPKVRRIAVLCHGGNPSMPLFLDQIRAAAARRAVRLQVLEVRGPDELDGAFQAMARERAGALLVGSDAMFAANRARLAQLVARSRLPSMHGFREYVEDGGLMSYGPSLDPVFRRAAWFVDRILKGARPADLPVEQPTTFELVVNLKAARALGVTIPPSIRVRADHVIE